MLAGWVLGAFVFGWLARLLALPPLVGFLAAGFAFGAAGVEPTPILDEVAEAGVLVLLFAVGLKLRLRNLVRAEVWGTAIGQALISALLMLLLVRARAPLDWRAALVLSLAFGFSSTVVAAKTLESKRELRAFHGRVAIGVLIVQDLVAVALLATLNARSPSPFAVLLLGFPLVRLMLCRLLDHVGHGELLVLYGATLAIAVGGFGFELLGLSPELGALLLGMLLADHRRSQELSDALWGIKELLLVGFFLSIGLHGLPSWDSAQLALLLLGALPLKALLFFALLLVFGLRARTGFLAGLSLATYSEFGLIVLQAAAQDGLLDGEWLVLSALAVALSFAVSAPLNLFAHTLYDRLDRWLSPLQKARRHPDDAPITFGGSEVLIVGMGRVGSGAYDFLHAGERQAVGIDSDPAKIQRHLKEGRRVVYADAEDPGFWERLNFSRLQAIMLAVPDLGPKLFASSQIRRRGFDGLLSATYVYPEELEQVLRAGCDVAYNYFTEAGVGFAAHTLEGLRAEGARREPTDTELARRLTT